ncbi:hypothetical protein DAEQUDRAFT_82832 [Daedalea quercina L-15889]|uniref:Uncharacterized protein n=1 Tax=Daedalea quercina L-15889 TaxID=1314783 RepID=A0A165SHT5_9APHY|nr:hypothetical protein DAEQUDRAFT_82832 [Daedalea quercina L-15889]
MCYHLITYCEYACGHQVPTRRHYLDCNRTRCRISVRHQTVEHDCANECDQEMLADQHLVMERSLLICDACAGRTNVAAIGVNGASTQSSDDSGGETSEPSSEEETN